jgi:hypothetical protein
MKFLIMKDGGRERLSEFEKPSEAAAKLHWRILVQQFMPSQCRTAALFRVDDEKKELHFVEQARWDPRRTAQN